MAVNTPGMPVWADLATPDLEASKAFYTNLFGWTATTATEPEAGGYTMFAKDGQTVAGVGPIQMQGQPTAWTTYISTADADETTALVEKAGGSVLVPPMDVMEYGRMAVFTDEGGAAFATWEPRTNNGADVFNVPGAITWTELATRDPQGAKTFYGEVFGWTHEDTAMEGVQYTTWQHDDRGIAGMMPMTGDQWPPEMPAHWMIYFAVEDPDAVAAKAGKLGATIAVQPTDIPTVGRFAVLGDPQGGFFSIIKMNPTPQ